MTLQWEQGGPVIGLFNNVNIQPSAYGHTPPTFLLAALFQPPFGSSTVTSTLVPHRVVPAAWNIHAQTFMLLTTSLPVGLCQCHLIREGFLYLVLSKMGLISPSLPLHLSLAALVSKTVITICHGVCLSVYLLITLFPSCVRLGFLEAETGVGFKCTLRECCSGKICKGVREAGEPKAKQSGKGMVSGKV